MKDSNVYQDRIKKDAVSSLFFFILPGAEEYVKNIDSVFILSGIIYSLWIFLH